MKKRGFVLFLLFLLVLPSIFSIDIIMNENNNPSNFPYIILGIENKTTTSNNTYNNITNIFINETTNMTLLNESGYLGSWNTTFINDTCWVDWGSILSGVFVPYTGATTNVDLGNNNLTAPFVNANLSWDRLYNYPVACPTTSAITQLGDSVICSDFWVDTEGDTMTGNLNMTTFNITTSGSGKISSNSTCMIIEGAISMEYIC